MKNKLNKLLLSFTDSKGEIEKLDKFFRKKQAKYLANNK